MKATDKKTIQMKTFFNEKALNGWLKKNVLFETAQLHSGYPNLDKAMSEKPFQSGRVEIIDVNAVSAPEMKSCNKMKMSCIFLVRYFIRVEAKKKQKEHDRICIVSPGDLI